MRKIFDKLIFAMYRLKGAIWRKMSSMLVCRAVSLPPQYAPRILGKIYLNTNKLSLGRNVTLYPNAYLWGNDIVVGNNVNIGIGTVIHSTNGIYIGDNTMIAAQCYIIDSNHGTKKGILIREQKSIAAEDGIHIGKDVWIGAQCSILKGAKIDDGAVIGANSMVNSHIPANAIAFGTPAKVIRFRE